jgi:hypothetical protein
MSPKIWIESVGKDHKEELSGKNEDWWTVPSKSNVGDFILFYFTKPDGCIKKIFKITKWKGLVKEKSKECPDTFDWTTKKRDYFAFIEYVTDILSPITYEEIMSNTSLSNSRFVLMNMVGRNEITIEHQKVFYDLIIQKNPELEEKLLGVFAR